MENKDWREEFNETISNVMGICTIDSLRIKSFIESLLKSKQEEMEGEIEKRKISKNNFDLLVMEYMRSGTLDTPEFTIRVLQTDFNKTLDDILSSLDKPEKE